MVIKLVALEIRGELQFLLMVILLLLHHILQILYLVILEIILMFLFGMLEVDKHKRYRWG